MRDVLKRATDAMIHRGSDDEGFYIDAELGLGNRRLSIIDLRGGHQPLSNEDGTIWITFNGEIYNYRELRAGLESRGHRFRTATDTEAIVHLHEDHDLSCLDHVRGMFALALWDGRRHLLLARDRLGIKLLFHCLEPHRLTFASELRALRELAKVPFDPQSVYGFFGSPLHSVASYLLSRNRGIFVEPLSDGGIQGCEDRCLLGHSGPGGYIADGSGMA